MLKASHNVGRITDKVYEFENNPRGGVLPYKRLMGCAAGWGRIFTTGLTIMGSHFQQSY